MSWRNTGVGGAQRGGIVVETKPSWCSESKVLDVLGEISGHVLNARHEEEFLEALARALRDYVGADALIIQLLERHIQTRAVATADEVTVLPPDELWEPFTREDERFWLERADGVFCADVRTSEVIKPKFREHALEMGLSSGYMAPTVRDGEICGQIVFAWKSIPDLTEQQTRVLRRLADYACLQFTLFNVRKGTELDPMTGLLNWYGLQRRWELTGARPRGVVLFVEIENFRAVVDRSGRLAGDDLLRDTARLLHEVVGPQAVMARVGYDAFVAVVPDVSASEAAMARRDITWRFEQFAAGRPHPRPYVTVGAAMWPQHGREVKTLVSAAEKSAYERKRSRTKLTMTTKGDPVQGRMPREFLHGWLATADDGILMTDADMKVIYVNPAYERMTGYTLQEWIGKTPGFVATGKTPVKVYEDMWQSLNDLGTWTGQVVNRHRSGKEWVSFLSITRIVDRSGRRTGFVAIARNVTDLVDDESMTTPSWSVFEDAFTKEALSYALAEAAQLHGGDSGEHLERVREFTHLLVVAAASRGIEEFQSYEFRSSVTLASILHDIGKLAVPQGLLQKPGKLTVQEFELVKTHTVAGRVLLQSPFLRGSHNTPPSQYLEIAAAIAGSHHERWDGTGYPEGLAGNRIPMAARVVAIADVYDALRSRRPYKEGWTHAATVAYIERQAGSQFDPELVDVFLSVSDQFEEVFARLPDGYRAGTA